MNDSVWVVEADGEGVVGVFSEREKAAARALALVAGMWPEDLVERPWMMNGCASRR